MFISLLKMMDLLKRILVTVVCALVVVYTFSLLYTGTIIVQPDYIGSNLLAGIALLVMLMRGRSLVRRRSDFVRKTAIPSPNVCVFSCSMCSCIKLLSVFGGGIGKFAGGFGCMSFVFVTLGCSVSVLKLFGGLSTPLVAFDSGIVAD